MFLMAIPVALCLRNSGSQTPDCWLKLDRNTQYSTIGIEDDPKYYGLHAFYIAKDIIIIAGYLYELITLN